jgi:hypothetical protein
MEIAGLLFILKSLSLAAPDHPKLKLDIREIKKSNKDFIKSSVKKGLQIFSQINSVQQYKVFFLQFEVYHQKFQLLFLYKVDLSLSILLFETYAQPADARYLPGTSWAARLLQSRPALVLLARCAPLARYATGAAPMHCGAASSADQDASSRRCNSGVQYSDMPFAPLLASRFLWQCALSTWSLIYCVIASTK